MDEREMVRRITSLQARMNRIEMLMEQLLLSLTSSQAHADQTRHIQTILQELRSGSDSNPIMAAQQERPEIVAIRQALLAGNKLKAIQLYRSLYGVSLLEAQAAIEAILGTQSQGDGKGIKLSMVIWSLVGHHAQLDAFSIA
jgi:ribosomal protein L7/L12